MGYDRSKAGNAFPAYLAGAGTKPTPTPIYHVGAPTSAQKYPSDRRLAQGAIPISIGPQRAHASPVIVAAAPTQANAGAIPVWP